jgi:hypothetical protein
LPDHPTQTVPISIRHHVRAAVAWEYNSGKGYDTIPVPGKLDLRDGTTRQAEKKEVRRGLVISAKP